MVMPKDTYQSDVKESVVRNWREFINNMEDSINLLDRQIDEAAEMREICTSEWCEATEHVIDDLSNSIFSIHEPHWASDEDSKKIKALRRRVHDLYAKYKATSREPLN
jgi:hypothetical protein